MSEQAVIRLMLASSCFGLEVCPAPPCACARTLNDLLGAEQDAEIARLSSELNDAREVLKGMDEIVARLRREKAELVEALDTSSTMMEALATQLYSWEHEPVVNWRGQVKKNAALRSASEKGEPT